MKMIKHLRIVVVLLVQISVEFQQIPNVTLEIVADPVDGVEPDAFGFAAAQDGDIGIGENGEPIMRELEKQILLRNVDRQWMDHIDAMDQLRRGIGLRAYGQTDPVVAYRNVGSEMFDGMNEAIREDTARQILTVMIKSQEDTKREQTAKITATSGATDGSDKKQPVRKKEKAKPNDPCPCGSGKKYKNCCGDVRKQ